MCAASMWEFESLVKSIEPIDLGQAGKEGWVEQAGVVEKLSVGAVLEAGGGGEEVVARRMVDEDKVIESVKS